MPTTHYMPILTLLLGALGMWLMLPRGTARGRGVGMVLAAVALGLGVSQLPWPGPVDGRGPVPDPGSRHDRLGHRRGHVPQSGLLCDLVWAIAAGHRRAVPRGRRPVPRRGHRGDLRRGDPGHVPLRAHARAARGQGRLRPRQLGGADCGGRGRGDGGHSLDHHRQRFLAPAHRSADGSRSGGRRPYAPTRGRLRRPVVRPALDCDRGRRDAAVGRVGGRGRNCSTTKSRMFE